MEEVEIRVCRMPSSTTTIAIKSLKMAPFEMLYGRRCRTPLFWMSVNWRNVCGCLKSKYPWKTWMLKKIFLIKSTPSRFWRHLKELHGIRRSICASYNRAIISMKKLLEKEKKSWRQSFQVSFPIHPNLRDEIHFKGGRFVTPWFSQGNKILENYLYK
jgi:hypothetical protein